MCKKLDMSELYGTLHTIPISSVMDSVQFHLYSLSVCETQVSLKLWMPIFIGTPEN